MKPWRLDGDDSLWRLCQWAVHSGIAVVEVNDSVLGQTSFEAVKNWAVATAPWPLAPEALSMRDLFTEANVLAQEAAVEGKTE